MGAISQLRDRLRLATDDVGVAGREPSGDGTARRSDGSSALAAPAVSRLVAAFLQLESRAAASVSHGIASSEREVLAAAASVGTLVDAAKTQADATATLVQRVGENSGFSEANSHERLAVSTFVGALHEQLDQQHQVVEASLAQLADLALAAKRIREIARHGRVLTINARIESARLGEHGAAFAVIAKHMSGIAAEIDATNEMMGKIVQDVSQTLPQLASTAASLTQTTDSFTDRFSQALVAGEQREQDLRECVTTAVMAGERGAAEILRGSYEVLSHLQFHDPMVQRLAEIPLALQRMRTELEATVGAALPDEVIDTLDGEAMRVTQVLARLAGPSRVAGAPGGESQPAAPSGQVVLF